MIPREINGQVIFTSSSWAKIMDKVDKYRETGMCITDFDYGNGLYVVVMSKVKGWNKQVVRVGSVFPMDAVLEEWEDDYYITNVLYDGDDWIVVMTGVDYCVDQKYIYRSNWTKFNEEISEGWKNDMIVTKLCCHSFRSFNVYLAAMTRFKDCSPSQSRKYFKGSISRSDLEAMCVSGRYIVDIFDFDGGVYVVTAGRTGWNSCKVIKSSNTSDLLKMVAKFWDNDYYITTVAYYDGEWLAVLGRKEL